MGFLDEYYKVLQEESTNKSSSSGVSDSGFLDEYYKAVGLDKGKSPNLASSYLDHRRSTFDAPLSDRIYAGMTVGKKKKKKEEEKERKWFQKGAFEDGYDFGDISKTILGTLGDVGENLISGVAGMGEKVIDATALLAPALNEAALAQNNPMHQFNAEQYNKDMEQAKKFVKKDLYDEEKVAKAIIDPGMNLFGVSSEKDSVFGEKSDALVQSGGQLLATAGLQAVGVPWWVTTGTTSFGGELEGALKEDASVKEAVGSAAISAGAEILSEKLSGGISFGGKTLDDGLTKLLARGISSKTARTLAKLGVDMAGEGAEEVFSQIASNLGSSLYKEESLQELLLSEEAFDEYVESFVGGAVLGGVGSGVQAVKANKKGVDYVSEMTANEQKVVDQLYKDRVAEAEKEGKVSQKEKGRIYDEVIEEMEKGYIETDTIEEILGGDSVKAFRDLQQEADEYKTLYETESGKLSEKQRDRLAELKEKNKVNPYETALKNARTKISEDVFSLTKGDRLAESYNERARRGQAYEADLTKYDKKQQATIQKAIDSGILNNTRRTHEFVDFVAKISADTGTPFEFADNANIKESGFAMEGQTVDGFYHNGSITVNIDSPKSRRFVVGHEITHALEGTELYDSLRKTVFDYAKMKNQYGVRMESIQKRYKEGTDFESELTADLVGEYIFSDTDFVNHLSVQDKNLFQRVFDEIKYLCKVATAGSKEARELEKVKRAFEKAYKEGGTGGYGDEVQSRGKSYVVFSPEQVKNVDNKKPTSNPDIRFSLSNPVEETKDLMALHNLTSEKLLKSLKLGGMPMPSVAIAKAKDGHGEFGEITLVLPKETIDPQASSRNKLYSGDAWTPTYPKVDYKLNSKALKQIRDKINGLVPANIQEFGRLHLDSDNMEDTLNRYNGDMVDAFKDNDALKYAYLMEAEADVQLPMKEKNLSYSGSRENGAIIKVAESIPAEDIHKALNGGSEEIRKLEPAVRKAVAEYVRETYGDDQFILDTFAPEEGLSFSDLDGYLVEARKYLRAGIEKTVDSRPARELIRDMTVQYSYEEWLRDLFSGIVEKEGIRNNKDYITPSGNRRSFEALHYEHNLENVIKAMREKGEKGIGFGGGSIFGAATTEFSSVDEMKQASGRLQQMSEEEYQEIKEGFSQRFFELASSLPNNKNSFMATDDAANALTEAVAKYKTKSGMANYLRRELKGWATYSPQVVDDLVALVNDIRNMPTGYFEAKPQRAVGFDEVGVFVIPYDADVKLKQELLNRGYSIAEYDPKVEGDRQRVVNGFEEYKFSLSNVGEKHTPDSLSALKLEAPVAETATTEDSSAIDDNAEAVNPIVADWRELAKRMDDPNIDNPGRIWDAVAVAVTREVVETAESGLSTSELKQKSQEAIREYERMQASKPYGVSYTESEKVSLSALHNQYSLYDSIARNPGFLNMLKEGLKDAEATASETEMVAPVTVEDEQALFPDEGESNELDELISEEAEIRGVMEAYAGVGDIEAVNKLIPEHEAIQARIKELQQPDMDRAESLTDADVPPEVDAPISMKSENYDPYADIELHEVSRSTRTYSDRNPGARQYLEDAALGVLYDINNSTHGERWYNDQLYYESGGEKGFGGTKRVTTDDIADLKDTYGYTWDELRKAAEKAANGDFRSVAAKRVEYLCHKRMMEGYTDVDGRPIPANEEYISFLNESFANEQRAGGIDNLLENADQYAPEDIAPVLKPATPDAQATPIFESKDPKAVKGQTSLFEEQKKAPVGGKVANVLTEEPKAQKKRSRFWSLVKDKVLDKGMVFEDLSKETGNREIEAKWNYIRYARSRAQRLIGNGTAGVKSLKNIKKTVEQSGKTEAFFDYLYHKHNVDRMSLEDRFDNVKNKAVFGDSVTSEMSQRKAEQYEKQNPEFLKWAEDVYGYMNHLRSLLVENDVISQETADLWEKMYPHYVPIRRAGVEGLNINVPLDSRRTTVNNPIKRAQGGNQDILPLFETMAQRTTQTYRAIARNSFGIELKNQLGTEVEKAPPAVDDVIDGIERDDALLKPGEFGGNPTFTVFENGEKVEFEITEDMYEAMKPTSEALQYRNKILGGASSVFRGLTTQYSIPFMATNAIKDAQDVLINSQHPMKTYANFPRAWYEQIRRGKYYQEYMENGGDDNTYFESESNAFTEDSGLMKAVKFPLTVISEANNFIEKTPRLAEYIASREAGRSIEVSMLDSARVTTNFAAGGDLTKFLNRNGATFLNASVQGAVQQVRNIKEAHQKGLMGYMGLAARFVAAGLPAVLLNNLLWDDDEEYEELADYVKQDYYIVGKYDDGKFIRIPKGRTVAVIQNAIEQVQNAATGDGEVDLAEFLKLAVNNLAPNNPLENNILAPALQAWNNETWYGEELVPSRLQDLPAAEQFDEKTDSFSRKLGEKLNISPYKINYLLNQYSGGLGDLILPTITPRAESGDDSLMGVFTAPLRDKFTTDSVINSQVVSDFYDTKDELQVKANSSKATEEDYFRDLYMDTVGYELSDLYKQKREIQNSDMTDAEKYNMSRELQEQIVERMKQSLDAYNNIQTSGVYAEVGDKRYNQDADSGKWYEIKPKNADGSDNWYYQKEQEVTKGLGISYEQYWNNREEYNFAYDKPDQYAVAKAVGGYNSYQSYNSELWDIKADKDKNGKSISGSRKEKVIDYINNLDADYGEKIILFKKEYNADDRYNYEIIEYLNGRDDISYQEMETILKYLGFEVDSEGNISW